MQFLFRRPCLLFFLEFFLLQLSKKNVCFVVSNDVSGAKLSPACPHFFCFSCSGKCMFFPNDVSIVNVGPSCWHVCLWVGMTLCSYTAAFSLKPAQPRFAVFWLCQDGGSCCRWQWWRWWWWSTTTLAVRRQRCSTAVESGRGGRRGICFPVLKTLVQALQQARVLEKGRVC